jgi:hypothetical protein
VGPDFGTDQIGPSVRVLDSDGVRRTPDIADSTNRRRRYSLAASRPPGACLSLVTPFKARGPESKGSGEREIW